MKQPLSWALTLLLSGMAAACAPSSDDGADVSEGSLSASEVSGGEVLDPAKSSTAGFVSDVQSSEQPYWELGKRCDKNCDKDYKSDIYIWGRIFLADGSITHFQNTSYVQWDDVTIAEGGSLEFKWAFTDLGINPEDTLALAWFIDDTGKVVDIVYLSSGWALQRSRPYRTEEQIKNGKVVGRPGETDWVKGAWNAKENFHGSVRFSLSSGFNYGTKSNYDSTLGDLPEHGAGYVPWDTGILHLDKTVRITPPGSASIAPAKVDQSWGCTIEATPFPVKDRFKPNLQTATTVCSPHDFHGTPPNDEGRDDVRVPW